MDAGCGWAVRDQAGLLMASPFCNLLIHKHLALQVSSLLKVSNPRSGKLPAEKYARNSLDLKDLAFRLQRP